MRVRVVCWRGLKTHIHRRCIVCVWVWRCCTGGLEKRVTSINGGRGRTGDGAGLDCLDLQQMGLFEDYFGMNGSVGCNRTIFVAHT